MESRTIQLVDLSIDSLTNIIKTCLAEQLQKLEQSKPKLDTANEKDFFTREETKNLLNVSYTTLWHWNNNGILAAKTIGRKVFYLKSEVFKKLGIS